MQRDNVRLPRMEWESLKPAPGRLVVVQRFVNTRTYLTGGDLLADAEEATAWLTEHGLLGAGERLDEAGRRRLLAFREVLRGLLVTHNGEAGPDVKALNDLVASTALKAAFEPDGRLALVPSGEGGPADRVLGHLLAVMVRAEDEGTWKRLKACRNEDCRWAFYDASKNRSGSWCDMAVCGARHKMRTYRKRKLESP
jgi:predicted RNA-binding Zn ribbon-like protein